MEVHADPEQDVNNTYDGYKFQTYLTFGESNTAKTIKCSMVFKNRDGGKVMHKNVGLQDTSLTQWCTEKKAMLSGTEHRFHRSHYARCSPWRLTACPSGDCLHMHYERGRKIYARCGIQRPFSMPGYAPLKLGQMLNVRSDIFIKPADGHEEAHAHFGWHAVPLLISSGAETLATGVALSLLSTLI